MRRRRCGGGAVRGRGTVVLALLAVLATACTVGPPQRPPVAVRGDRVAAPAPVEPPAPPGPRTLPEPQSGISTIPFDDCTAEQQPLLRTPLPPDRGLRIECGTLQVPTDPEPPSESTTQLQVIRVGKARTGAGPGKPPLAVV